ncbi:hypothetical protein [Haladaptatus halobius]|uniref:hypothetical protein n=1 Tax=Haladaptatus halobius TaxID=2884875 RepID=UPI001D0B7E06|nr:hypothetical protein [Haladaptatus halobius]
MLVEHSDLVAEVESIVDQLPDPPDGKHVIESKPGHTPMLLDGNHRATAIALHLLRTGEFVPVPAYVAKPTYVPFTSLDERLQAVIFEYRHT